MKKANPARTDADTAYDDESVLDENDDESDALANEDELEKYELEAHDEETLNDENVDELAYDAEFAKYEPDAHDADVANEANREALAYDAEFAKYELDAHEALLANGEDPTGAHDADKAFDAVPKNPADAVTDPVTIILPLLIMPYRATNSFICY